MFNVCCWKSSNSCHDWNTMWYCEQVAGKLEKLLSSTLNAIMDKCGSICNFTLDINQSGQDLLARGAKSGGTGEPGSQKVNWPAESFWAKKKHCWNHHALQTYLQRIAVFVLNDADYYVIDKDFNINCNCWELCRI